MKEEVGMDLEVVEMEVEHLWWYTLAGHPQTPTRMDCTRSCQPHPWSQSRKLHSKPRLV